MYSLDFIKYFINVCGINPDIKLYNQLLKHQGGFCKMLRIIYLLMDLDINPEISKHLKKIMPKDIKIAKSHGQNILKTKQIENLCVKDIIEYFEAKALEIDLITEKHIDNEPLTLEGLINSGLTLPQAIDKYIKNNKGDIAKYSFKCAICGHQRHVGRYFKCGDKEFEVCKFCFDNVADFNTSSKIIYTPMGNKR